MKNIGKFFGICMLTIISFSCSKKTTATHTNSGVIAKPAATAAPKIKTPTPESIVVNDNAAKKTVDGRYYYDLNGKRYWRNNKDGKYYLFNKSMYNNPDFKGTNK